MPISTVSQKGLDAPLTLTSPVTAGTPTGVGVLTSDTAKASTSGTFIDFTGIPSWVKRITVMFSGVSQSGTSSILVQLGDSGGIETTGYAGSSTMAVATSTTEGLTYTTGFGLYTGSNTWLFYGTMTITLVNPSTNLWVSSHTMGRADAARVISGGGNKSLSETLDKIRITTINGTDTFDAGTINILYE
jgi:hypothetical protein